MEIGIRATKPALENARPPGVASSSRYVLNTPARYGTSRTVCGLNTPGTVRDVSDSVDVTVPARARDSGQRADAERAFARMPR